MDSATLYAEDDFYVMRTIQLGKSLLKQQGSGCSLLRLTYKIGETRIANILPHWHWYPSQQQLFTNKLNGINHTLVISKHVTTYLPAPHGNCSSYAVGGGGQPFGSESHVQCMRRCVRQYNNRGKQCVDLFVDKYAHELDFDHITRVQQYCFELNYGSSATVVPHNITAKCLIKCPKNCVSVDYTTRAITTDTQLGNHWWHNLSLDNMYVEKRLVWDSTQPLYVYREEPVLSLMDYMCYAGGLFGLWFGANGKDFIIRVIDSRVWVWLHRKYIKYLTHNRVQVFDS